MTGSLGAIAQWVWLEPVVWSRVVRRSVVGFVIVALMVLGFFTHLSVMLGMVHMPREGIAGTERCYCTSDIWKGR